MCFYLGGESILELNKIYLGDCLEVMKDIPDKSIDMILCDLPYGTTACKWDTIIPFEPLWKQYDRVIKDNGVILLSAVQPFSSKLVMSNLNKYKYTIIWQKSDSPDFVNAKKKPINKTEDLHVFTSAKLGKMTYNPQGLIYNPTRKTRIHSKDSVFVGAKDKEYISEYTNYPINLIYFKQDRHKLHSTQKPEALLEYLIKTYTNENELVLDNCIGSGTTAIACINTNRQYIGIEKDKTYYDIANKRINEALNK